VRNAIAAVSLLLAVAGSARANFEVFLVTELTLRDPHAWAPLPLFGCRDATDNVLGGLFPSVNDQIATALSTDGDNDGMLDLSPIIASLGEEQIVTASGPLPGTLQFDPAGTGGELAFHFGACAPPATDSNCEQDPAMPVQYSLYSNGEAGTCLAPAPGTTGGYSPAILLPQAPCLVSDPFRMTMDVAGLHLELDDARIAATYSGSPTTALVDGLIVGFLTEAAADTVLIAPAVPFVGGQPISSILPGGTGCCASRDDRDLGPDGADHGLVAALQLRRHAGRVPLHVRAARRRAAAGRGPRACRGLAEPVPRGLIGDLLAARRRPRPAPRGRRHRADGG
jgi:hypothetical protein